MGVVVAMVAALLGAAVAQTAPPVIPIGTVSQSVGEVLQGLSGVSIFTHMVLRSDVITLYNSAPSLTVLVPIDDAFAALPLGVQKSFDRPEFANDVVLGHTIGMKVMARDMDGGYATLNSKMVYTRRVDLTLVNDSLLFGKKGEETVGVLLQDMECANGVIHLITAVLAHAVPSMPTRDVFSMVQNTLYGRYTGLQPLLQGPGPFTVTVPTEEAFAKLSDQGIHTIYNDTELRDRILRRHIFPVFVELDELRRTDRKRFLRSLDKGVPDRYGDGMVGAGRVVRGDEYATNGIVHYIDTVLLPPGGSLNTLATAIRTVSQNFSDLIRIAGIQEYLRSTGPFTVLIPAPEAINGLSAGHYGLLQSDRELLRKVVLHHVVHDRLEQGDFVGTVRATLIPEDVIRVQHSPQGPQVSNGKGWSFFTNKTVDATNGKGHIITDLLIPSGIQFSQAMIKGYVEANSSFSTFNKWLNTYLDDSNRHLLDYDSVTVFAPVDAAFDKLTQDERNNLYENTDLVRRVLRYHISYQYYPYNVAQGTSIANLDGTPLTATADGEVKGIRLSRDGEMVGKNGVVHVIDTILLPDDVFNILHEGWGWSKCTVDDTKPSKCTHQYQCYAHHTSADHVQETGPPYTIGFTIGCVGVGCFCRYVGKSGTTANIPYTILIFILGCIFGGLTSLGSPFDKYGSIGYMDPHLIFYIFLPALIFKSSFTCDVRVFRKVFYCSLLLAGPGLMVSSLLTGTLVSLIFKEYSWSFIPCLLFGVVVSTTDPIAIVGVLQDSGLPGWLSMLIEGESLLNDGTAIVIFDMLRGSVNTGELEMEWYLVILEALRVCLGGPLIGLTIGTTLARLVKEVFNDPYIEVSSTLVAAYSTFFLCEGLAKVSGVLGVVALGATLSHKRTAFSPEVMQSLNEFWGVVAYVTNTMVFGMAGLIVTQNAFQDIKGFDFGYLIIMYLVVNIVRGVTIFLLTPCLRLVAPKNPITPTPAAATSKPPKKSRCSIPRNVAEYLLVAWGGVRGAVGLALALIVKGDDTIYCFDKLLGDRFLFHTAGIVVLTLCINGATIRQLIHHNKLNEVSLSQRRNMYQCFNLLTRTMEEELLFLKLDPALNGANFSYVKTITYADLRNPYEAKDRLPKASPQEHLFEARAGYFALYNKSVTIQHKEGLLLGSAARILFSWAAEAEGKECGKTNLNLVHAQNIDGVWEVKTWKRVLCCMQEHNKTRRWGFAFNLLLGFIRAHEYVLNNIDGLGKNPEAVATVKDQCKKIKVEATELLHEATKDHGEVSIAMRTKAAARHVLNVGRIAVDKFEETARLSKADADVLRSSLEVQMNGINKVPRSLPRAPDEETLRDWVEWYKVDQQCMLQLSRMFRYVQFAKEQRIFKADSFEECRHFYVILKGIVRVHVAGHAHIRGQGYCIGLLSSLTDVGGRFTETYAESNVHLARFPASEVRHCTKIYAIMRDAIWLEAGRSAAHHCLAVLNPWKDYSWKTMQDALKTGKIMEITRGTPMALNNGVFYVLFNGKCRSAKNEGEWVDAVHLIPERFFSGVIFDNVAMVFSIPDPSSAQSKARKRWQKIHDRIRVIRSSTWLQGFQGYCSELREVFGDGVDGQTVHSLSSLRNSKHNRAQAKSSPKLPPSLVPANGVRKSRRGMAKFLEPLLDEEREMGKIRGASPDPSLTSQDSSERPITASPLTARIERRVDPKDGKAYTKDEFLEEYGRLQEWDEAIPLMDSTSPPPEPRVPSPAVRAVSPPTKVEGGVRPTAISNSPSQAAFRHWKETRARPTG